MKFSVGKHSGKDTRYVLLKDPDYVRWTLNQANLSGGLLAARKDLQLKKAQFDAKPFVAKCFGNCKKPSTRASVYLGSPDLFVWCDSCDPYSRGALQGKLDIVRSYDDALKHVEYTCGNNKAYMKDIIRQLATAKGMPARFTASAISNFLP
jgi:hypothetical protein